MNSTFWSGLLDLQRNGGRVTAAVQDEATRLEIRVEDPGDHDAQVLEAFLERYALELTPAGLLVVDAAPTPSGAGRTGIPLTDEVRARQILGLPVRGTAEDARCAAFWDAVMLARRRTGGHLAGLFSNVHLASACPYVLTTGDGEPLDATATLARAPALREASLRHLGTLMRHLRPQLIVPVGRLAFEAVASISRNPHELAAELALGWGRLVEAERRKRPRAEFPGFRARVAPVDDLLGAHAERGQLALADLLSEGWT